MVHKVFLVSPLHPPSTSVHSAMPLAYY